jgi:hypothetical protein
VGHHRPFHEFQRTDGAFIGRLPVSGRVVRFPDVSGYYQEVGIGIEVQADVEAMTTINVPDELVHEIDLLAGVGQRSAYVVDVLWKEIRRTRQREALRESAGAWAPENHPELIHGGAAFLEATRSERDERFEKALDRHLS